jgi:nucleoid DNA-binding protein
VFSCNSIGHATFDARPIIDYTAYRFVSNCIRIKSMATVSKKDLVDRIADKTQTKRSTVKVVVQHLLDEITTELARSNRLEFRGFGVFEPRTREARAAQNPKTLEKVQVPAKRKVRFKMGRMMRERLSNGEIVHG